MAFKPRLSPGEPTNKNKQVPSMKTFRSALQWLSRTRGAASRNLPFTPWSSRLLTLLSGLCVEHQGALLGCMPGAPVLYSPA
ncbi:hypothetical protein BS643_05560 [Pseudomonas protegens]|uniref:hypothetical protein n=1 Tax=Pseudomonas TaxID=286 RepID=UPI0008071137|nr:hypothetical protein [Pseudomonas protegens]OBZ23625.1 hypothetical protein BBH58_23105 [Pseudomonas protegens]OBZ30005.1 hypothetical protein BBH57_08980 [Pseudomonas protegens]OKK44853.1 hypothetical protein BS644_30510 [Pseudomonas protegens]OKK50819.1 hypothetical protein BS643_05560 [Pseudomonas protegens]OKK56882.1 hypothetical protein BS645_23155 [Pseudomonas protegens]